PRVPLNSAPGLTMSPSPCTGSPSGTDVHQHKNNKGSFSHLATLKHNLAPKNLQDREAKRGSRTKSHMCISLSLQMRLVCNQYVDKKLRSGNDSDVIDYENNWQAATRRGVASCSFACEVDYGQYVLTSICQEKQREHATHPEASLFLNPHLDSAFVAYTTAKAAGAIIQPDTKTLSLRLRLQSNKKPSSCNSDSGCGVLHLATRLTWSFLRPPASDLPSSEPERRLCFTS
ncbi:hypothetical protein KUCAC02_027703, partial [Chaenocephalus aceratus]